MAPGPRLGGSRLARPPSRLRGPNGSICAALLEQRDAIPLADLSGGPGQSDLEMLLSADDFDNPEETTLPLLTDGIADALAVEFTAESGADPFVAFDGCR